MAIVHPFRGLRYDPEKVQLGAVVAPPYDVIPPRDQEMYYRQSPHNVVRLILGKHRPEDDEGDNPHTRAAAHLQAWRKEKILVDDPVPTLYVNTVDFPHRGQTIRRFGLIARVRLEPFENGIILPHEKTYSKIKSERLGLMKACHTNFSPIFSLYPDPEKQIQKLLHDTVARMDATLDFIGPQGHRHRLWRITDGAWHARIADIMKDSPLFIADGHHRYETAMTYRNEVAENDPGFPSTHPANFVMMCLSSMADEGLLILPAHRLLTDGLGLDGTAFRKRAEAFFEVHSVPLVPAPPDQLEDQISAALQAPADQSRIGVVIHGSPALLLLTLRPDVMDREFGDDLQPALRGLDVTVLTRLILMGICELTSEQLDDETRITYTSRGAEAVEAVADGRCEACFLLNPTKIEQVRQVADAGLVMPRKSTYFFPKVITGEVMHLLTPPTSA